MDDLGDVKKVVEAVLSACFGGSLVELQAAVRQMLAIGGKDEADGQSDKVSQHADGTFNCVELAALESLRDTKKHGVAHIAAAGGNLDVLQYILTALPSLAHVEDENGENPLFYAIRAATGRGSSGVNDSDFLSCVLLLLGQCGPNCVSKSGASPLHVACELGALDICRLLVENHADVDVYSDDYGTPLTVAVIRGYVDIINYLLSQGANPDGMTRNSEDGGRIHKCRFPPPLAFACSSGQERVFDMLISAGASVSVCDPDGWTPLHCAAEMGSVYMVEKLLGLKADCNIKVQGKTPYHLAVWNGHSAVASMLSDITVDKGPVNISEPSVAPQEESEPEPDSCAPAFNGSREELDCLVANLKEEGRTFVANKDYANACTSYSKAIALLTGVADTAGELLSVLHSNRSHTYLMLGKLEQARKDAERCIALNPSWPKGYFRLASVDKASGREVDYLHNLFQAYSRDTSNTSMRDLFQREFERARNTSKSS
ncbi:ankyrin repeat family protein, putative [Babesia bigemina]|uniref:Ankyrin repeat family protein, putative n=1 Tax=Babesia bigemina TaxID=5866 RepID=A0A061DC56_BABBI|nr:ankyrin repeat family protein, putative [Babesia bigemina]CDR96524.1 ankyrin repeat family protein, putative [Babesia bigemina]|eukprot:XP_012768710.1 ankyrin repeat family protein, putative [Babesia bigemina]